MSATTADEEYILQWNDHKYNFFSLAADDLFRSEELTDVTVCCGDQLFDAHKLILSVCSPYFRTMLGRAKNQHPIVFLKDVKACDFERLLHFMYYGEVRIPNNDLESLIQTAKSLKIKGLASQANDAFLTDPCKLQDQPENYSVNNNRRSASPSPPPPQPQPAPLPPATKSASKKEQNPTPPKKRRISASALNHDSSIVVNDENAHAKPKRDDSKEDYVKRKALTPPASSDKDSPPTALLPRPPSSTSSITDRITSRHHVGRHVDSLGSRSRGNTTTCYYFFFLNVALPFGGILFSFP